MVSAKSKIHSPSRGYGNSIVLGIAAALLFISVTLLTPFLQPSFMCVVHHSGLS